MKKNLIIVGVEERRSRRRIKSVFCSFLRIGKSGERRIKFKVGMLDIFW